jgi:hypothetical protein
MSALFTKIINKITNHICFHYKASKIKPIVEHINPNSNLTSQNLKYNKLSERIIDSQKVMSEDLCFIETLENEKLIHLIKIQNEMIDTYIEALTNDE